MFLKQMLTLCPLCLRQPLLRCSIYRRPALICGEQCCLSVIQFLLQVQSPDSKLHLA